MRREGCKDGCFWTIVSSDTCAKAVCASLSQCQHGVGCQGKPCGCDCPSQLWKFYSQILELLKSLKISTRQWNIMRNSGGLITGLFQDAWKVWGFKPLSKQCGSGLTEICSGNRRSCPKSWTHRPNQCRTSSGAINTWECTTAQRDTSLLLLWRRSDGQEQSISLSGTLRTGKKMSSWMRTSSPSRSSTTTRTRFMLKRPMRWRKTFWGDRETITLPTPWFGGRCPIRQWHIFIFARKGETGVQAYQEDKLQGVVKHLNMTFFSGQELVFQQGSVPAQKAKTT